MVQGFDKGSKCDGDGCRQGCRCVDEGFREG
jgi:hypothetical protein